MGACPDDTNKDSRAGAEWPKKKKKIGAEAREIASGLGHKEHHEWP